MDKFCALSNASLAVIVTFEFKRISLLPFAGTIAETVGGVWSAVVKVELKSCAKAMPLRSLTKVVITTVKVCVSANTGFGVKVTVVPSGEIVLEAFIELFP